MFPFPSPPSFSPSKCYATYGTLGHLDISQLPKKKKGKPWTTLQNPSLRFLHTIDLTFPEELQDVILSAVKELDDAPVYHRVFMSLENVLEKGNDSAGDGLGGGYGDGFFWKYVKPGDAIMLSQGSSQHGNVLQIYRGILTMFLDKETYERAGMEGKPHGVKGKRGTKPRWVVEVDLTKPSMVHGKKGFDRLMYAAKNVFNHRMAWILCGFAFSAAPDPDPLAKFQPDRFTINPAISDGVEMQVPPLKPTAEMVRNRDEFDDFAMETYEWLSLNRLRSPRVEVGGEIDPYLSLYKVPGDDGPAQTAKIRTVSWRGMVSPEWAQKILMAVFLAAPSKGWFSFSAGAISKGLVGDTSEMTVLRPPDSPGEYMLWDIKGPEAG